MKVPFLDLKAHHDPLREEFVAAIAEVIDCGAFAGGPYVSAFEKDFAAYCRCEHAIGVGNGTEAIWLPLLALGIGAGDEVITVPGTFMATAEAITHTGATPVFVDVDEHTYTMAPAGLERALTRRTKAIIPVHLFGQTANMDPILDFARAHGLYVIEDAAQAHGAEYRGRRAGSMGDAASFSFYPGKNLGAMGEAGGVVTNNADLAAKVRTLRDHGQSQKYHHTMVGWNSRMDGFQAAVLRIKLRNLERGNDLRRAHAARYDAAFAGMDELVAPRAADYARHVYHIYAIRVQERDEVMRRLGEKGIGTGIHYPIPVHLQDAYGHLGYGVGAFPVAEQAAREFISLPMFPELSPAQIDWTIAGVREAVAVGAAA